MARREDIKTGIEPEAGRAERMTMGDAPTMVAFIVAGALVTLFFLDGAFAGFIPKVSGS